MFFWSGGAIDMQDLKDLKRFFHGCDRGGQAPALRARKESSSPCTVREQVLLNYRGDASCQPKAWRGKPARLRVWYARASSYDEGEAFFSP